MEYTQNQAWELVRELRAKEDLKPSPKKKVQLAFYLNFQTKIFTLVPKGTIVPNDNFDLTILSSERK